ncbi:MAG: acyltransferase [Thermoplasmata archaeon]|nr:acyltransferase [Thermoplasmata archaeon]
MVINKDTDPELREQILKYHLSGVMTDRERASLLGLPEGCRIRENAKIISPKNFKCGKNVWIGEGAILDASGGLEIGDNTQVGLYTLIWTHTSRDQAIAGETGISREKIKRTPTKIGKNCFIGGPSVIYPGVKIGDGVTILPMSVVTRDVKDGEIVAGAPIGKLKELEKRIEKLENVT